MHTLRGRHICYTQTNKNRRHTQTHQQHFRRHNIYTGRETQQSISFSGCTSDQKTYRRFRNFSLPKENQHRSNIKFQQQPSCGHKKVVFKHCSTEHQHCSTELRKTEEKRLVKVFRNNGYPRNQIRRWTTKKEQVLARTQIPTKHVILPYIKNVSEFSARLLKSHGISVAHKPNATLQTIVSHPKENIATMDKK